MPTKNIPPIYKYKIPTGNSPYKKTGGGKMSRPGGGRPNSKPSESVWGTPTRGGGSTINPTGTNR